MAPPPLPPSMSAASGHQTGQSSQPPQTLPPPDLFAELLRLGLNPDDVTKQSPNRPQVREEVLKNLQSMLGKRDSADILRKLLPMQNDWQTNQQTPDFQRPIPGGSANVVGNYRDNTLGTSILSSTGGSGTGGALSFTNNIINGNSSQQQEQDVQYASAQQQQQHQAAASAVNHHQHFRIPTTSTTMHNSPLQQQQLLTQHNKSVLSLHHQQQQHHPTHPHQNDPTHRQRLNQQHKLNSLPNSSMANINDISGGPSSSSLSSSNAALLDAKNSSIFSHRTSPAISSYTIPSAGTTPRVPNIMDAIGGQPGLDNMHDTTPFQHQTTMNNRDKLKSLAKHQHLQKQFRTSTDKHKNLPWSGQGASSSANLNLSTDSQSQQRIIGSNINNSNPSNMAALSQLHRQMTSPLSSAISPPQASPGLPKSLLNLAACSTSPPNASPISSTNRGNQLSGVRSANVNHIGNSGNTSTKERSLIRNNANNQRTNLSAESSNLLQQIMARSASNKNAGNVAARPNHSNFSLSSLLSDDQSSNSKNNNNSSNNNNRSVLNQNTAPNMRPNSQSSQPVQRRPSSAKSDDSFGLQVNSHSKDAYLAYLQERAAKGGVSIGEITCSASSQVIDQPSQLQSVLMAQHDVCEPNDESQVDIESALSRVEARNDLSLLYPPVSLASNSQKQINSLSAGIKIPEDVDIFTDEVKRIVQEGCNIIYECKTCNNLFRSLANLVKHKRLYCKENANKSIQMELNRRSNINSIQNVDMSVTKNSREVVISRPLVSKDHDDSKNSLLAERPRQPGTPSLGSQKYNLRGKRIDVSCLTGDSRANRAARNQQKDSKGQNSPSARSLTDTANSSSGQTNLSRLLQSQPRNRVGPMKVDSALMDALSMSPTVSVGGGRGIVSNSTIGKFNEQLVRNSSLAKTLLSENVKSINGNQSNFDMSNLDYNAANDQKPMAAPKRKFLEDCIRKVKRDKLGPNDSGRSDSTPGDSQETLGSMSLDESERFRDPLDIDDSGADSDALVMDVDESYLPQVRKKSSNDRRLQNRSHTRAATSSLEPASRLNSSSALLKALTRPVEPKPSYPAGQKLDTSKQAPLISDPSDDKSVLSEDKTSSSTGNEQRKSPNDSTQQSRQTSNIVDPVESITLPRSPILDKFNCEACAIEFPDHQSLFEHIINDHKSLKKIHPCIFCSLSFITLENVCRHIIDIHKKTKTQVGRLKDVVESRSFYSSDFTACTDVPLSCKEVEKDKVGSDRKVVTPDALSDLVATEQILNDTVALVSMATSPGKSSLFSPSKRLPSLVSRTSSRLAAKRSPTNDESKEEKKTTQEHVQGNFTEIPFDKDKDQTNLANSASTDEAEDLLSLSDSMIPSITDEHLAILERQEAEIEAERLRKEQEDRAMLKPGPMKTYHEVGSHASNGDNLDDDSSNAGGTQTSVEPSNDEGSVDQDEFVADEDSNQWAPGQNDQMEEDENEIDAARSCKNGANPSKGDDENQSTLDSAEDATSEDKSQTCMAGQEGGSKSNKIELDHVNDDEDDDSNIDGATPFSVITSSEEDSSSSSSSSNSLTSTSDNDTDTDSESSDANNVQRVADEDDNDLGTNDQMDDYDEVEEFDEAGGDQQSDSLSIVTSRRKASNCGSTKRETDLNSSDISDKISKHEYYDNTSSHSSSKASSKATAASTIDGGAGCKLKLKAAASSSNREVGSGGSGASTSSSGAAANSSSGGIMKLKIQLKTQPDEKSKVYRIVE